MKRIFIISQLLLLILNTRVFGQLQVYGNMTLIGRGNPGDSYEGAIKVQNLSDESEDVRVYLHDYHFFADGRALYGEPGSSSRSNAGWVQFSPSFLTIPAGAITEIGYRVEIPENNELVGSYWSLLLIEGIPDKTEIPEVEGKMTVSIQQVVRFGIQLITEIGDTGFALLAFENPKLQKGEESREFSLDIVNTGQVWLLPEFSCTIYDLLGEKLSNIETGMKRLYPGTSVHISFILPNLEPGSYRALIVADAGEENLFGGNYTLRLDEQ